MWFANNPTERKHKQMYLDRTIDSQTERVKFVEQNIDKLDPMEAADYILQADPNHELRPPSKHKYWQKRDDKHTSYEDLQPHTKISAIGSNHYTLKKPQLKEFNNEKFKAEIERVQQALFCATPNTKEYSALRHLLISMRSQAYILGDSENPTVASRTRIQPYSETPELDFSQVDLSNTAHIRQLYENYAWGHCSENLDLRDIYAKLDLLQNRTLLIPWHRELLDLKKQNLTHDEIKQQISHKTTQPYYIAALKTSYKLMAETYEHIEMEQNALFRHNPDDWRYCEVCNQWYLNTEFFWRKKPLYACKNCLSANRSVAHGSKIFKRPN